MADDKHLISSTTDRLFRFWDGGRDGTPDIAAVEVVCSAELGSDQVATVRMSAFHP